MAIRKVQIQHVYSGRSNRSYCRLRLPRNMAEQYVAEHGENQLIRAESPDTLRIGGPASGGTPVRLLDVRERRGIIIRHFRQVMIPVGLSGEIRRGEPVDITREGDTIRLKFEREIFVVDERAVPDRPPPAGAHASDAVPAAPDDVRRRLAGIENGLGRLEARGKRIEGRLGG